MPPAHIREAVPAAAMPQQLLRGELLQALDRQARTRLQPVAPRRWAAALAARSAARLLRETSLAPERRAWLARLLDLPGLRA
jgi:hypothetical protein